MVSRIVKNASEFKPELYTSLGKKLLKTRPSRRRTQSQVLITRKR